MGDFRDYVDGGEVRVVDSSSARERDFGNAAYLEDGVLTAWHITDDPDGVVKAIRSGKRLTASYRKGIGKYAELGPGLYVSAVPDFWTNRSTGKWDFLEKLTDSQKQTLAAAIRDHKALKGTMLDGRKYKYVSDYEVEAAERYIRTWLDYNNPSSAVLLAGQPYNIPFWKPEFLKPLGIESSPEPQKLKITFSGKFADLTDRVHDWPVIADCIRRGLDGGFNPGGMVANAELCIWKNSCVIDVG